MRNSNVRKLTTSAIMLALAFVLSYVKFFELPNGGGLTLLSMLPICLVSIKYGLGWGLGTGFCYAFIQIMVDMGKIPGYFEWLGGLGGTAMLLFDYLVAFTVLGLAGLFRNKGRLGFCFGTVLALFFRYVSSVISGAAVWKSVGGIIGLNFGNTWIYSIVYNAVYMVPEIILTAAAAVLISALPQVQKIIKPE